MNYSNIDFYFIRNRVKLLVKQGVADLLYKGVKNISIFYDEVLKMKKYCFILALFSFFFSMSAFAKNYSFEGQSFRYCVYFSDFDNPGFNFSFFEKNFSMDIPELNNVLIEEGHYIREQKKSAYKLEEKQGFIYLHAIGKDFLVLYYKDLLCALVDCEDNTTYFGVNEKSEYVSLPDNPLRTRDVWIGIGDIARRSDLNYSSYLTEKERKYDNNNKYSWQLKTPWVEGIDGSGVGEWIEKSHLRKINKLVLLNGFVDLKHPDYFYKNERIKDVEISIGENSFYYTLEDTPQLQIIELPDYYSGTFRITIKSVYEGTKYTDTCLSLFLFLYAKNASF